MEQLLRVRVRGPLAGHAPELIGYLVNQGYADHSVTNHLYRACTCERVVGGLAARAGRRR